MIRGLGVTRIALRLAGTAGGWPRRPAAAAAWRATAAPSVSTRTGMATPGCAGALRATTAAAPTATATTPVRTTTARPTAPGPRQQQRPPPARPARREQQHLLSFFNPLFSVYFDPFTLLVYNCLPKPFIPLILSFSQIEI